MQKVCFSDREKSSELLHLPKLGKTHATLYAGVSFTEDLS
ncbi:hypothetical protein LEP1GSC198_1390 [Leptospira kirschneri str. JB]|nr:hypothetical protein LEP1GSC198_1390 [Leptospira kirschneri str. JB]